MARPVTAFAAAAAAAGGPATRRPASRAACRSFVARPGGGAALPRRAPSRRRCHTGLVSPLVASAGGAAAPRPGEGEGEGEGGREDQKGDAGGGEADATKGEDATAAAAGGAGAGAPDAGAAKRAGTPAEKRSTDDPEAVPLEMAEPAAGQAREDPVPIEYLRPGENEEEVGDAASEGGVSVGGGTGKPFRLPLFPLSMVLHPGTEAMPLHIFEMRYRLLFNRISDGDKRFGIVMFDKDAGTFARYGCIAEMTRMDNLPDGRMMTLSDGVQRFRILKMVDSDRDEPDAPDTPYLVGLVQLVSDATATAAPKVAEDAAAEPSEPTTAADAGDVPATDASASSAPPTDASASSAPATGEKKEDEEEEAAEAPSAPTPRATPSDTPAAPGPPLTSLALWQLERAVWVALQDVLRLSNKLYDRTLELNASLLEVAPPNVPTDAGLLDAGTKLSAGPRAGVGGATGGGGGGGDDADAGSLEETIDAARVRSEAFSFAVAAILDQPLREQQRLLQTVDTGVRLRSLLRLLDAARRYLAAQSQIKDALS